MRIEARGVICLLTLFIIFIQPVYSQPGNPISTNGDFTVGCYAGGGGEHFLSGKVDEIRLSNIARSNAWIKATYYSNSDNLIIYGSVQDTSPPAVVDSLVVNGEADGKTVILDWSGYDESGAGDVAAYHVYLETEAFSDISGLTAYKVVDPGSFTYTIRDLIEAKPYYVAVVAVDNNGNANTTVEGIEVTPVRFQTRWANQMKLFIHPYNIDEDLSDFPILIHLSASSGIYGYDSSAVFQELSEVSDRKKIAVFTAESIPCFVEIETWDPIGKEAWLWVKVPQISDGEYTRLFFCYDRLHQENSMFIGDTGQLAAQRVWDSDYLGVWHMGQDPAFGLVNDSTQHLNHATSMGAMTAENLVEGMVGKALLFDGVDDYLAKNLGQLAVPVTMEAFCWFENDSQPSLDWDYIVMLGDSVPVMISMARHADYAGHGDEFFSYSGNGYRYGLKVEGQKWNYYALCALKQSPWLAVLRDGVVEPLDSYPDKEVEISGNLVMGSGYSGTHSLYGMLDEVRISKIARSSAWLKASYYSAADSLVQFGPFEPDETTPPRIESLQVSERQQGQAALLDWSGYDESLAADIIGYRIYAQPGPFSDITDQTPLAAVSSGSFTYLVEGLDPDGRYYFAVVPVDRSGNMDSSVTAKT
ncbi:MAG: hypothetical protein JRI77_13905, partial [Deltaproteobacteria bacterium]|nr:hypothetical protein [Deltaproteobacteria bacterium]